MGTNVIEVLPTAKKEILSLSGALKKRIGEQIDFLKTNPRPPGEPADYYRLAVGEYRILYGGREKVIVIKISRRAVYRESRL
jgi:mRNA-degrading endonuclease RelE of RelBE toxin-antitoxin system